MEGKGVLTWGSIAVDERAYITGGVLAVANEFSAVPKGMAAMIN